MMSLLTVGVGDCKVSNATEVYSGPRISDQALS